MNKARRLLAVVAGLTLAALVSSSHTHGEPAPNKVIPQKGRGLPEADKEALVKSRFEDKDSFTYEDLHGQRYFALEVKPQLKAHKSRPSDILILVSASAAQA